MDFPDDNYRTRADDHSFPPMAGITQTEISIGIVSFKFRIIVCHDVVDVFTTTSGGATTGCCVYRFVLVGDLAVLFFYKFFDLGIVVHVILFIFGCYK